MKNTFKAIAKYIEEKPGTINPLNVGFMLRNRQELPIIRLQNQMAAAYFRAFTAMGSLFSIAVLSKVIKPNIIIVNGTAIRGTKLSKMPHKHNSAGMSNKNTRFQKRFLVNNPCFSLGADRFGLVCLLGSFIFNSLKSCIVLPLNSLFKTYFLIIPHWRRVLNQELREGSYVGFNSVNMNSMNNINFLTK